VVLTDAAGEMDKKNAEKDKLKAETAFYEMDENKDNRYLPSFILAMYFMISNCSEFAIQLLGRAKPACW